MDFRIGEYLSKVELPVTASHKDPDKALVIVESRPCFFLPHVIATAVATHPGWHLYVFAPKNVHEFLSDKVVGEYTRVTIDTPARMTIEKYNALLYSRTFWDIIHEEHILIFQSDCVLVRTTPRDALVYDYIGAACGTLDANFVMNGGLSLRRRSAMLRALDLMRPPSTEPEDIAFCRCMRTHSTLFTLPTLEDCMKFAIESLGDPTTAIGMHGTDKYYAHSDVITALLK